MKKLRLIAATLVLSTSFLPRPSAAMPREDCFQRYVVHARTCAEIDVFVYRTACGLDAGIQLAGCVRRVLLGL